MKEWTFGPGTVLLNGQPFDHQVVIRMPEYGDTGLIHGGTWNARGAEARIGKARADALVRTLRLRRKAAR